MDKHSYPSTSQVWTWLQEVMDPEIPVVSVVDLGIVREVRWSDSSEGKRLVVTITPTYSGCPATALISDEIARALRERGVEDFVLETRLSPAWTTDWLTGEARERLRRWGIAPPAQRATEIQGIDPERRPDPVVSCPRCGCRNTVLVSQFSATPCKALYRCRDCLEPFDYFKCH
jgi:ring-1,2-phenylacetyl-CoA epoxidase subunit PaaD